VRSRPSCMSCERKRLRSSVIAPASFVTPA